ncbi:MAG: HAMP domain-containing protein [Thermoleophilia bacterium]|nr:HAMP domain-containing protein [Thermoleophilia bacterium]
MAHPTITRRLTTAFALVMTVVLLGSGITIYFGERFSLDRGLRRDLTRQVDELTQLVNRPGPVSASMLLDRTDSYAQVLDGDGAILAATPVLRGAPFLTPAQLRQARAGIHTFDRGSITTRNRHAFRIRTRALTEGREPRIIVTAVRRDAHDEALRELVGQLLGIGGIALALTIVVGYRLTRAAMGPVERLREQADELYHHDMSARLDVPDTGDELARLATTLNSMLGRIDATVERERTFAADASHELRTPLAALNTEIELALRRPRSAPELTEALANARGDVRRLIQLAEDLLLVIRTPESQLPDEYVDLPALISECVDRARRRAPDRTFDLRCESTARIRGSSHLIERAVDNLLANAIGHGAGAVVVTAFDDDTGHVQLHVSDSGTGFPEEFLPQAFGRFTRADRGRSGSHSGLGMSIVKTIASAHGGDAGARNAPGGGADVWITLPRA